MLKNGDDFDQVQSTCKNRYHVVPDFPRLSIRSLFRRTGPFNIFQKFYGKKVTCFYFGSYALWQGIKLLQLNSSNKVLVPAYHCGIEIECILKSNVKIEFYKINEDMSVDLTDLENKIKKGAQAMLVIHYFGFAQPIEVISALCSRYNLFLIEDCAHSLFSVHQGKPLGTYGDIVIFSQRKSLPLADGGALMINNQSIASGMDLQKPKQIVVLEETASLLLKKYKDKSNESVIIKSFLTTIDKLRKMWRILFERDAMYDEEINFDIIMGLIGMSSISKRIMDDTDIDDVIKKRRFHFQYLLDRFKDSGDISKCLSHLPDGICPLFFPVRITGNKREETQKHLLQCGIQTFIFGKYLHQNLPTEDFSGAELLSKQVLCLPIHQNLSIKELDFMLDVMNLIC